MDLVISIEAFIFDLRRLIFKVDKLSTLVEKTPQNARKCP